MKYQSLLKNFFLTILLLLSVFTQAAYFRNIPLKIMQPNGLQLTVYATGDEYYNWIHDANNFTIVKNHITGYYVYAALQGIDLVPTACTVGLNDPANAGLVPGINIPDWRKELIRKDFLDATPKKPSVTPPSVPLSPDVAGTVNNIVVFIRFSDQEDFSEPLTTYSDMFNNTTSGENSMYNYFKDVSYNNMFVTSSFYPLPEGSVVISYQDSNPRDYYAPYDETSNPIGYQDSERTEREHTLLKNAVDAIAAEIPAGLDIDFDDDGNVDNVCFIIKGTTTAWSTLLWPHRWSLYSQTAMINGKQVWDYNLQLETFLASSGVGVLAHEMTHTFGCPDLYHYSDNGISPVGPWDLMDGNTNPPQHIGAYMKKKYTGWISSIPEITTPGTYTLNPLSSASNNAYKLISPNSSTEFFVFEYRKKAGTFEGALPNSGLLIYRINTLAGDGNAGGPPDEIYLYRPGGTDTTNGAVYDAYFSLASGRTTFSDFTNPNDWLSDGVTPGGIHISNITDAGSTISFTVDMNTMAEFSANMTTTCLNQTITFTDQSFASPTSWSWSIDPNTYSFVNGTSATSQNPQIQFNATGDYSVTLTASGPNGSNTLTKTDYIHILPSFAPPLTENFELGSFINNNWTIQNPDGTTTWSIFSGAQGNGSSTKCATMNFYNYNSVPAIDDLIAKPIALPSSGNAKLTFKVAYRQYDNTYHDSLKVYISTDCGITYSYLLYSKGDASLATGVPTETFFVPSVAGDWRKDSIDLSNFIGQTITVRFRAINGYGNNLYVDDINISVNSPVTAGFTGTPTSLCQGQSVQFTDLSTGSPTNWNWNFGDNSFSTQQNPSHVYNLPGIYTVTLTASKPGSSNTFIRTNYITVNALQTVTVNIDQTPSGAVCQNTPVTFHASAVNGGVNPSYQWKKNGINVGSNSSSFTTSDLVNGDHINCFVTSDINCPATNPVSSNTLTVSILPNYPVSVTIEATPSVSSCEGNPVTFLAHPVNGGNSPSFQWFVNGVFSGNGSSYTSSSLPDNASVYCLLTSSISVCAPGNPAQSNILITDIHPLPVINLGNDTTISISSTLTLNAGSGYAGYLWNNGSTNQTIDVSATGEYAVTVTDSYGCSGSDFIQVTVGFFELQGYVKYNNIAESPLNNTIVNLKQGNTIIASTSTNSEGFYHFTGLPLGSYTIASASTIPWGGGNATDALLIMRHFVGISYLTGLPLKAASVDNISTVNALDALLVQRRFVGDITSFPVGDWVFETPSLLINGETPVIKNIKGLSSGDVNSSRIFTVKLEQNVSMDNSEIRCSYQNNELILPLYLNSSFDIGAISLHLQYPDSKIKLRKIQLSDNHDNNLIYTDHNGSVYLSWANIDPMIIESGEPFIFLYFDLLESKVAGHLLTCLPGSEIANSEGIPYDYFTIQQPYVAPLENAATLQLSVFPNPMKDQTHILFTLPENSMVDLWLFNFQGQQINILSNQYFSKGSHEFNWNTRNGNGPRLNSGVYYLRLITNGQAKILPVILTP